MSEEARKRDLTASLASKDEARRFQTSVEQFLQDMNDPSSLQSKLPNAETTLSGSYDIYKIAVQDHFQAWNYLFDDRSTSRHLHPGVATWRSIYPLAMYFFSRIRDALVTNFSRVRARYTDSLHSTTFHMFLSSFAVAM